NRCCFASLAVNNCAARHGPSVWELEGPTPILNISNTEMASCGKGIRFYKDKGFEAYEYLKASNKKLRFNYCTSASSRLNTRIELAGIITLPLESFASLSP